MTQGFDIQYIHRDHRSGFKAGALKDGLQQARGELIGIFDAETEKFKIFLIDFAYFKIKRN